MKRRYRYLILFVFLLLPSSVQAYGFCSTDNSIRYQKLATNIGNTYTYTEQETDAIFEITLYNVHKELFIQDIDSKQIYYPKKDQELSEIKIGNLPSGKTYRFAVYTSLNDCEDRAFHTIYVNAPKYNRYYKYEECKGIEDYRYCQKWATVNLTEEEFRKDIQVYKDSLNKKPEEKPSEEDKNGSFLWDFISEYRYYIIAVLVVIFIFLEVWYYKKTKREIGF